MSRFIVRTTPVSDEERRAARERLREVLPHLFLSANMAQLEVPNGTVHLAVAAKGASSEGGRLVSFFEAEEFLRDLEAVVGPILDDSGCKAIVGGDEPAHVLCGKPSVGRYCDAHEEEFGS